VNTALWWTNVVAWSAQVAVLAVAGALLLWAFRIRLPRARLFYYQALLAVCLLWPLTQPWRRPVIPSYRPAPVTRAGTPAPSLPTPTPSRGIPWQDLALAALGAGATIRALWLTLGLWRLRRYRLESDLLYPLPESVDGARLLAGADADVFVSGAVNGPVTFGFLRPAVLLPLRFRDLAYEQQHAIACHEYLHVRRRDWLVTVCEEAVGALLWFHPVIWWLLSRIRLTREQVVDREVVQLTRSGQPYIDAMLAMAGARPQLDLAPAPLFLRKRHLSQRLRSLLKEVSMSKARLISSFAFMSLLLALTGWFTLSSFPLQGTPEVKATEAPTLEPSEVTVDTGGKILHRPGVSYPLSARRSGVQGLVVLELSLNKDGTVSDARVVSGPQELRKDVLESVLQWHYLPDSTMPKLVQASIDFRLLTGSVPPAPSQISGAKDADSTIRITLQSIDYSAIPESLREILQVRLSPYEGKPITPTQLLEIFRAVSETDQHLHYATKRGTVPKQMILVLTLGDRPQVPPASANFPKTEGVMRIRVGGNVQAAMLQEVKRPVYPPSARQARLQGMVRLDALIDTQGRVRELKVQSGHPDLTPAAMEAVRQWVYKPTLMNGQPVEVVTVIDVNFTLSE
jgi:TonB family protein